MPCYASIMLNVLNSQFCSKLCTLLNVGAECGTWFRARRMWLNCQYSTRQNWVLYRQWDHNPGYHKSHMARYANIKWFKVFFQGACASFGAVPFNIAIRLFNMRHIKHFDNGSFMEPLMKMHTFYPQIFIATGRCAITSLSPAMNTCTEHYKILYQEVR